MHDPAQRQATILRRLSSTGHVKVADLSNSLGVSEVTVRKDLRALEERDLLHRTHGGATVANPFVFGRPLEEKTAERAAEKDAIGRRAADLVLPSDYVLLASGSTLMYVARYLREIEDLTVATSAMNVATVLSGSAQIEVMMLGGTVRHDSTSVVGPYAEQMLEEFIFNRLFLGVDGIDLEFGLTTTSAPEARLNRQMIEAAQETIVVTDSSKFGQRGFCRISKVEAIDCVVTDTGVTERVVDELEARDVKVYLVEP